ncbi:MAG: tRNA (adenosine(37)-N6)-threonylcarbamoyltransferase complex dimerization subunit type 1 TsaB [Candidatus Limnocylindrales bacterium]
MTGSSSWLLALDTATTTIVVAAGSTGGELIGAEAFEGRYRHSQELLPAIVRLIENAGLRLPDLAGIVVGTGPGAFTGLRVGIATAKTLAHELGCPIVGVASSSALLAAVDGAAMLWLPSGLGDRVAVVVGADPTLVAGGDPGPALPPGAIEVAVDLDGRASEAALALGREAVAGLAEALLRLGAARLAAGEHDDAERLVPRYARPVRGALASDSEGGVAWSRDPR